MSDSSLLELLENIRARCRERENRLRTQMGLSPAQFRAISLIEAEEIVTCRDFSDRLSLSESRGSRVIDSLVRDSLLVRTDCDADRRCKRLRLTPRGRSLRRSIADERGICEAELASAVPAGSLDRLKSALHRLADGL